MKKLHHAIRQAFAAADEPQQQRVRELLDETRRKITRSSPRRADRPTPLSPRCPPSAEEAPIRTRSGPGSWDMKAWPVLR